MSGLAITDHAETRMSQRSIHPADLDLILRFGIEVRDGVLVRKKDIQAVERMMREWLKRLKRIEGKRLVISDGCLVTAFHASRREQANLLRDR